MRMTARTMRSNQGQATSARELARMRRGNSSKNCDDDCTPSGRDSNWARKLLVSSSPSPAASSSKRSRSRGDSSLAGSDSPKGRTCPVTWFTVTRVPLRVRARTISGRVASFTCSAECRSSPKVDGVTVTPFRRRTGLVGSSVPPSGLRLKRREK